MTIIEKAKVLGEALRDSAEFKALNEAESRMHKDEVAEKLFQDLQAKQRLIRINQMQGKQVSDAEIREIQNLQVRMQEIKVVQDYHKASENFNRLLQQVNAIIQQTLTGEEPHVCTHCGKH